MKKQNNIALRVQAFIFIGLMLFPIFAQALHATGGHEHKVCNDMSTHMHESTPNCELHNLILPVFDDIVHIQLPAYLPEIKETLAVFWSNPYVTTTLDLNLGRGPPIN